MSSKGKLKCRKVSLVLRFFTPNKNREYENNARYLLLLLFPFRNEVDLKVSMPPSYTDKIAEPDITDIINRNRAMVAPFSEIIDEALLHCHLSVLVNSGCYQV